MVVVLLVDGGGVSFARLVGCCLLDVVLLLELLLLPLMLLLFLLLNMLVVPLVTTVGDKLAIELVADVELDDPESLVLPPVRLLLLPLLSIS